MIESTIESRVAKWQDLYRVPDPVPFLAFPPPLMAPLHIFSSAKDAKAAAGQTRNFLVRASCRLRLEPEKEYLIMGLDGSTYDLKGE